MFSYVILYYQNKEITIKCVEKLFEISDTSHIIIVYNKSPNGSGVELKDRFKSNLRVHVILSDENQGFAKGNNIGFIYAKETYSPTYIVVMNNDVFVEQKNFETEISRFMVENNVDVCGPDIVTLDGNHQNPLLRHILSNTRIKKEIILGILKYWAFKVNLVYKIYLRLRDECKKTSTLKALVQDEFNCILHGACVIYGSRYIKNERIAFLPITYMYGEEAILYDYLQHKSYRTGISSETKVTHLQGKSTYNSSPKDRYLYKLKNITDSYIVQLRQRKVYEKLNKEKNYKL